MEIYRRERRLAPEWDDPLFADVDRALSYGERRLRSLRPRFPQKGGWRAEVNNLHRKDHEPYVSRLAEPSNRQCAHLCSRPFIDIWRRQAVASGLGVGFPAVALHRTHQTARLCSRAGPRKGSVGHAILSRGHFTGGRRTRYGRNCRHAEVAHATSIVLVGSRSHALTASTRYTTSSFARSAVGCPA